jgi:hypothetical protein
MKKSVFALALLVGLCFNTFAQQANTQQKETVQPEATIVFEAIEHNYGDIAFGSDGTCTFKFTNKLSEPLLLSNVRASCGCTTPQWTKEPVKPNETGEITVKYNTNSAGPFNKTIMVYSSGQPSPVVLRIKGNVLPKDTQDVAQQ